MPTMAQVMPTVVWVMPTMARAMPTMVRVMPIMVRVIPTTAQAMPTVARAAPTWPRSEARAGHVASKPHALANGRTFQMEPEKASRGRCTSTGFSSASLKFGSTFSKRCQSWAWGAPRHLQAGGRWQRWLGEG